MKTESSAPSEDSLRNKRRSFLAGLVATGLLYATPVLLCVNEAISIPVFLRIQFRLFKRHLLLWLFCDQDNIILNFLFTLYISIFACIYNTVTIYLI